MLDSKYGLGDALQFASSIPTIAAMGGAVLCRCSRSWCACSATRSTTRHRGVALPHFDVDLQLLSIPRMLGSTLQTVPAEFPDLHPEPTKLTAWQHGPHSPGKLKVGVVWAGKPKHKGDAYRSLAAKTILPRLIRPRRAVIQPAEGAEARMTLRCWQTPATPSPTLAQCSATSRIRRR